MSLLTFLLIQLNIAVLYLLYRFGLSRSRNFKINRFFLLCIPLFSMVIAFIQIPQFTGEAEWILEAELNELIIGSDGNVELRQKEVGALSILSNVLIYGAWVWLILLIGRTGLLFWRIYHAKKEKYKGFTLLVSDLGHESFSFFNWVYLPSTLDADEKAMILKHELEHVRLRHSFDLFVLEFLHCLFWFNPVYSLLKRTLKAVHEFQADILPSKENKVKYGQLILAQSFSTNSRNIVHSFHESSLTKIRVMMLTKSKKQTIWQYALILPVLTGLIYLSSCSKKEEANDVVNIEQSKGPITNFEDLNSKPEFPGGNQGLFQYLGGHMIYPKELLGKGVEGRVYVTFIVNAFGKIEKPKVLKTDDERLNEAALEVFKDMPDWIPAQDKNAKNVATQFTLPIMFKVK